MMIRLNNSVEYYQKLKEERQLTTMTMATQKDKKDGYSEQDKPKQLQPSIKY